MRKKSKLKMKVGPKATALVLAIVSVLAISSLAFSSNLGSNLVAQVTSALTGQSIKNVQISNLSNNTWSHNQTKTISWSSENLGTSTVDIIICSPLKCWPGVMNTPNDGSQDMKIYLTDKPVGPDYYIKVRKYLTEKISAKSPTFTTTLATTTTVTSPTQTSATTTTITPKSTTTTPVTTEPKTLTPTTTLKINSFGFKFSTNTYSLYPVLNWNISGPADTVCKLKYYVADVSSPENNQFKGEKPVTSLVTTNYRPDAVLPATTKKKINLSCTGGGQTVAKDLYVAQERAHQAENQGAQSILGPVTSTQQVGITSFTISPTPRPEYSTGTFSWTGSCSTGTNCPCRLYGGTLPVNNPVSLTSPTTLQVKAATSSYTYRLACVTPDGSRRVVKQIKDIGTQVFFNGARPLTDAENAEFPPVYNQVRMRYRIVDPTKSATATPGPWIEVKQPPKASNKDGSYFSMLPEVIKNPIDQIFTVAEAFSCTNGGICDANSDNGIPFPTRLASNASFDVQFQFAPNTMMDGNAYESTDDAGRALIDSRGWITAMPVGPNQTIVKVNNLCPKDFGIAGGPNGFVTVPRTLTQTNPDLIAGNYIRYKVSYVGNQDPVSWNYYYTPSPETCRDQFGGINFPIKGRGDSDNTHGVSLLIEVFSQKWNIGSGGCVLGTLCLTNDVQRYSFIY
jgi:hypothetical protein